VTRSQFDVQSVTLNRSIDFAYKAFIGYQVVPQFAVELAYVDLGKPKTHVSARTTMTSGLALVATENLLQFDQDSIFYGDPIDISANTLSTPGICSIC
jgi:hypothetical protein